MALDSSTFYDPQTFVDPGVESGTIPKVPGWLSAGTWNAQEAVRKLPWWTALKAFGAEKRLDARDVAKTLTESTLALLGLVALLPLFAVVAVAIKLDSRGPVFYRQLRTGKDGKTFNILKFRTMTVESGNKVVQATRNDARVTRVGRILRKTSIDELPQLINVLMGDMALVGPRPHAIEHDKYYGSVLPMYKKRFAVRPGLTGWAQIHGLRGETETLDKMEQRIRADLEYIRNRSFRLDLAIIFMTPLVIFFQKTAY